jgi:hypothetical protein
MKKIIVTIGLLITQLSSQSQQFINGDLNPTWSLGYPDEYTWISNEWYNIAFEGASWWGPAKLATYIEEPNDNVAIMIHYFNEIEFCWIANFSMELDQPLTPGVKYRLSYKEKHDLDTPMIIEGSHFKNTPGVEIGQTLTPDAFLEDWRDNSIEFTAIDTFRYFNFILDYEQSSYYNSGRALDDFNLEIVEEPTLTVQENTIDYNLKYNVYSIDGKLLYNNVFISELVPGFYILENNNQTFKLIK